MRETDDIERMFQESFEGFEVTPPASVKTAIDKGTKSTKRIVWWLSALFIMLAAGASSLIYFNTNEAAQKQVHILAENTVYHKEATNQVFTTEQQKVSSHHSKNKAVKTNKLNSISAAKKPTTGQVSASEKSTNSKNKRSKSSAINKAKESRTSVNDKNFASNKSDKKAKNRTEKKQGKTSNNSMNFKENQNESESKNIEENKTALNNFTKTSDPESIENNPIIDSSNVSKIDSVQTTDSTSTASNTAKNAVIDNNKDKPKSGDEKWLISYYLGPQFDFWKTSNNDLQLKIKPSIRTSVEISRKLKSGYSISSGLGYNKFNETANFSYISSIDSTYLGTDSIPIYDPQNQDSVIGYNIYPHYNIDTTKGQSTSRSTTTAFYIPVSVGKTFELSDKWVVMTDLGATFSFYKTKIDGDPQSNSPVKNINSFGINAALRLYGGYKFNRWMVTAGFTYSIYLKTPVVYNGMTSQRMFVSPQLGIHYTF